jgi:hypothetical protein
MKYVSYIFENQDVRATVTQNESLVDLATNSLINANIHLESYVYNNLSNFVSGVGSLAEIYENIRNFIISENTALYSQYSEILADSQLSAQEKAACFIEADNVGANISPDPLVKTLNSDGTNSTNYIEHAKAVASNFAKEAASKGQGVMDMAQATAQKAVSHVQANPYIAAAAGAGALGLGAYGAYHTLKNRKQH